MFKPSNGPNVFMVTTVYLETWTPKHPNITTLTVKGRPSSSPSRSHLNVVYDNFTAFPSRPNLSYVEFSHFNEMPDQIRFPLNGLLEHNKHRIYSLSLSQVKMLSLTEADFTGFHKLRLLKLVDMFLVTISPLVFNGLGKLPSGIELTNYTPRLEILTIGGHPDLKSLDWIFLQPLSNSLEALRLSFDSLSSSQLTLSSPFQLNKLSEVSLKKSPYFSFFPEIIYNSLNVSVLRDSRAVSSGFFLENLPLCPTNEDCSCCEMQPFVDWLRKHQLGPALRRIHCGPITQCRCGSALSPTQSYADGGMLVPNYVLHDHCVNGSPKTLGDTHVKGNQPFTATCVRGAITKQLDDIDGVILHQAGYNGDRTSNCTAAGYSLYKWIADKAGLGFRRAIQAGSVTATCTGKGVISVGAVVADSSSSIRVSVKVESTKSCLDFFSEFLAKLMAL